MLINFIKFWIKRFAIYIISKFDINDRLFR